MTMRLQNPPTFIEKNDCKFVIMDAPTDHNVSFYVETLMKHKVKTLVRTCEPTYSNEQLEKAGIQIIDSRFTDDEFPSNDVIDQWLKIVYEENFIYRHPVGVHCVAGLGRSPFLVAIALIEFEKMEPVEAIDFIRKLRKGAINQKQFTHLKNYKPQFRARCCIVL